MDSNLVFLGFDEFCTNILFKCMHFKQKNRGSNMHKASKSLAGLPVDLVQEQIV